MAERVLLTDALKEAYDFYEPEVQRRLKLIPTTCTKGCAHCCYLLTIITESEAMGIAMKLALDKKTDDEFLALVKELGRVARESDYVGVSRRTYFKKKLRCPFLTTDDMCGIYEYRPSCCRYHYVRTRPFLCSPHAPEDSVTESIGMLDIEEVFFKMDEHFRKDQTPSGAPIALAVLWAMKVLIHDFGDEDDKHLKEVVDKEFGGLKTPKEWLRAHLNTIDDSEVRVVPLDEVP